MLIGICCVIGAVLSGHGGFMSAVRQLAEIPSDNPLTQDSREPLLHFRNGSGRPSGRCHSTSRDMGIAADGSEVLCN